MMIVTPRNGGAVLQVLQPMDGGYHQFNVGATSSAATTGFSAQLLRIVSAVNANVLWANGSTAATVTIGGGMYYAAGVPEYLQMATTHILAYISATGALGSLYVTECG